MQARIDGELKPSERVIVDQHMAGCKRCRSLMRQQQSTAALMFEALFDYRLKQDLCQGILDHLPEMQHPCPEAPPGTNWRHESPRSRRSWQFAMAAAVAVLVMMAGVLYEAWPNDDASGPSIGVVTQADGVVTCNRYGGRRMMAVAVKALIPCGRRLETGPDSTMMITLRGPTNIKLDENTSITVSDDRKVDVRAGRVLLDVSREEREFRVATPMGDITVLGTVFQVEIEGDTATVTVEEGKVRVENEGGAEELEPGEQVDMIGGDRVLQAVAVDVASRVQWAEAIQADPEAYVLFRNEVQPRRIAEMEAEQVFFILASKAGAYRQISSIRFNWETDVRTAGRAHCGYDVLVYHVSGGKKLSLFQAHIDGDVFEDEARHSCEIHPAKPISGIGMLFVKVVPDYFEGDAETSFTKVSGLGI